MPWCTNTVVLELHESICHTLAASRHNACKRTVTPSSRGLHTQSWQARRNTCMCYSLPRLHAPGELIQKTLWGCTLPECPPKSKPACCHGRLPYMSWCQNILARDYGRGCTLATCSGLRMKHAVCMCVCVVLCCLTPTPTLACNPLRRNNNEKPAPPPFSKGVQLCRQPD